MRELTLGVLPKRGMKDVLIDSAMLIREVVRTNMEIEVKSNYMQGQLEIKFFQEDAWELLKSVLGEYSIQAIESLEYSTGMVMHLIGIETYLASLTGLPFNNELKKKVADYIGKQIVRLERDYNDSFREIMIMLAVDNLEGKVRAFV